MKDFYLVQMAVRLIKVYSLRIQRQLRMLGLEQWCFLFNQFSSSFTNGGKIPYDWYQSLNNKLHDKFTINRIIRAIKMHDHITEWTYQWSAYILNIIFHIGMALVSPDFKTTIVNGSALVTVFEKIVLFWYPVCKMNANIPREPTSLTSTPMESRSGNAGARLTYASSHVTPTRMVPMDRLFKYAMNSPGDDPLVSKLRGSPAAEHWLGFTTTVLIPLL